MLLPAVCTRGSIPTVRQREGCTDDSDAEESAKRLHTSHGARAAREQGLWQQHIQLLLPAHRLPDPGRLGLRLYRPRTPEPGGALLGGVGRLLGLGGAKWEGVLGDLVRAKPGLGGAHRALPEQPRHARLGARRAQAPAPGEWPPCTLPQTHQIDPGAATPRLPAAAVIPETTITQGSGNQ